MSTLGGKRRQLLRRLSLLPASLHGGRSERQGTCFQAIIGAQSISNFRNRRDREAASSNSLSHLSDFPDNPIEGVVSHDRPVPAVRHQIFGA